MPSTPSLQIPHMNATDTNKYVEANSAITNFDAAFCDGVVEQLGGSPYVGTLNISDADYDNNIFFIFQGSLVSLATVIFPSRPRMIVVQNKESDSPVNGIKFQVGDGSGGTVTITDTTKAHVLYVNSAAKAVWLVS